MDVEVRNKFLVCIILHCLSKLLIASVPLKSYLLCDSPLLDPTVKCVTGDNIFFLEITFLFEVHHDRTSG